MGRRNPKFWPEVENDGGERMVAGSAVAGRAWRTAMAGPAVPGFGGKPELEYGRRWKRAATGRRPVGGLWPKMENDGDGLAVPSGWR